MAAVQQDGLALEHAWQEMKNDAAIVMAAVQQDGRALKFASKELQAALAKKGPVIRTLAAWLKNPDGSVNVELAKAALRNAKGIDGQYNAFEMKNVFTALSEQAKDDEAI